MALARSGAFRAVHALGRSLGMRVGTAASVRAPVFAAHSRMFSAEPPRDDGSTMPYYHLRVQTVGKICTIQLNRKGALNALNKRLVEEIITALEKCDEDEEINAIILTGSGRAFAAGADIKEMNEKTFMSTYKENFLYNLEKIRSVRKPIIAAVNGFALGGGCELAMLCDIIISSDQAVYSQPEIQLGTIPGAGGTQRLIRAVGKSKAMQMILTGEKIDANEALQCGLTSKVVPHETLMEKAMEMAKTIAGYSSPITIMAKEATNAAEDMSLTSGLQLEKRLFHATFATADQKEGMGAFVEKRKPEFINN